MTIEGRDTDPLLWGSLLHLSYNMWDDHIHPDPRSPYVMAEPHLRFDESLWNDLLRQMAEAGMNLVVLDLGDGVRYESHPEIAVENAWTPAKLRGELAKARALGLEPIPNSTSPPRTTRGSANTRAWSRRRATTRSAVT